MRPFCVSIFRLEVMVPFKPMSGETISNRGRTDGEREALGRWVAKKAPVAPVERDCDAEVAHEPPAEAVQGAQLLSAVVEHAKTM